MQNGEERTLGFSGQSFNDAQRRYMPTEGDLQGTRFGVQCFKHTICVAEYVKYPTNFHYVESNHWAL